MLIIFSSLKFRLVQEKRPIYKITKVWLSPFFIRFYFFMKKQSESLAQAFSWIFWQIVPLKKDAFILAFNTACCLYFDHKGWSCWQHKQVLAFRWKATSAAYFVRLSVYTLLPFVCQTICSKEPRKIITHKKNHHNQVKNWI